jgi:toxin CptA
MHRAPAVSFSVARSQWHLWSIVLLSLLASATTWAFVQSQSPDFRSIVLAGTVLAVSAVAFIGWQASRPGCLRWDGQQWHWSGFEASRACRLALRMDFQKVLLVSLHDGVRRPVWLWLEETTHDPAWKPLRRAIVSSQSDCGDAAELDAQAPNGDAA